MFKSLMLIAALTSAAQIVETGQMAQISMEINRNSGGMELDSYITEIGKR